MRTESTVKKRALAFGFAALSVCAQAFATSQCPTEFGEKNPLVNAAGWAIVGLGLLAGIALMVFIAARSRSLRWPIRIPVLIGGAVAMILVATGALGVAISAFFLRC